MFSSGLLITGKTSLSNRVGMESSLQVDDLDEDNIVVSLWRSIGWKLSKHTSGLITASIIPIAELESVKCRIFSVISIILLLKKFIESLRVRALGTPGLKRQTYLFIVFLIWANNTTWPPSASKHLHNLSYFLLWGNCLIFSSFGPVIKLLVKNSPSLPEGSD